MVCVLNTELINYGIAIHPVESIKYGIRKSRLGSMVLISIEKKIVNISSANTKTSEI